FLREATHPDHAGNARRASLDVSVTRFRARGADTQYHNIFTLACNLDSLPQRCEEKLFVTDYMIRRKHANHRFGRTSRKDECCEPDGRSSIGADGLSDDLRFLQTRQLTANFALRFVVRDNAEAVQLSERCQARHRLLNHGLASVEGEQLLRSPLAAQRPE